MQTDQLLDNTDSPKVNFANNDESEPEGNDEDEPIKHIANNFSAVEKTGPPIGTEMVIINRQ